ncbi:MAG: M48 family metallopeptidase [Pirellulaceae bacterium]
MQLSLLVALVVAIVVSENAPHEPVAAARLRLLLALAGGLVVILFAAISSRTIARSIARAVDGDQERRLTWLRAFARLKQVHLGAWLAVIGITLFALNWPQLVRYNWGLDHAILVKDLLVLAPIWLPLLLSWTAFYEVDLAIHRSLTRGVPEHGSGTLTPFTLSPFTSRGAYVWMYTRHYLGLGILPMLMLLVFQDTMSLAAPGWESSRGAWAIYLIPLTSLTVAFPYVLSRIWKTGPLPAGPLRKRLTDLTRRMGVRCGNFRIWHTDRQILNAAVAGLLPSVRTIFMTDALLLYLRDEELEAVIAHELGHVRRRHLLLRLLLLGLPLWMMGNLQALSPQVSELTAAWPSELASAASPAPYLITVFLALGCAVLALGWYSRLLEHDADLCVYEAGQATTFIATVDRLSYLCNDRRQRATWLHPSTASRIDLLQRVLHDPQVAQVLRRRVRRVNCTLVILWVLAPLAASLLGC